MLHHQVTSKFCPTPKNALGGPGMLTVTTKMPDLIGLALLKEEVFRWLTPVPGSGTCAWSRTWAQDFCLGHVPFSKIFEKS